MRLLSRLRERRNAAALPDRAWFDEPDALSQIDERAATDQDRAILDSWVRKGYAVVEGVVPHEVIDRLLVDVDGVFTADRPRPALEICDLEFDESGVRETVDHAALLSRPVDVRLEAKERSSWRVHALIRESAAAREASAVPELERIASMILGFPSKAAYSINFHRGSKQALHEDSAVFHLGVPNMIVGAWIACEDVTAASGPLVYHPGSHRRPMYEEFGDYPNINFRTATAEMAGRYNRYVADEAEAFEEHRFLARKGDVLFWHGMLIHGGAPIDDSSTTRKSYVLHFIPPGADALHRVTAAPRY